MDGNRKQGVPPPLTKLNPCPRLCAAYPKKLCCDIVGPDPRSPHTSRQTGSRTLHSSPLSPLRAEGSEGRGEDGGVWQAAERREHQGRSRRRRHRCRRHSQSWCMWLRKRDDDLPTRRLVFTFLLRIKRDGLLITEHCSGLCLACIYLVTGTSSG